MNVPDVTDVSNLEQVARHLLEAKANIEAVERHESNLQSKCE